MALGDYSPEKINRLQYWLEGKENRLGDRKLRQNIDLNAVYALARCMLSLEDIATNLGISRKTIDKWMNQWPEFAARIIEGQSVTRNELSSTQLKLALSGNPTMLIWLGKQYLHQADKHEQNNRTEISITVQKAMDELRTIPRGQLLEAQALLERPAYALVAGQESAAEPDAKGCHPLANGLPPLD